MRHEPSAITTSRLRSGNERRTSSKGYSVPLATGLRGAGLGNECISWGKAAIAADVLGLRLIEPQWGLNRRGYSKDFGTSRLDWARVRAMRALPTIDVDNQLLDATGHRFDYRLAMEALRNELPTGSRYVLRHQGMAGGFATISSARPFLRSKLLGRVDLPFHPLRDRPHIVFHVRADDFEPSETGPKPGQWNTRVPVAWYRRVARIIKTTHPQATMEVLTDQRSEEIRRFESDIEAVPGDGVHTVLGDLDRMVNSDLLVCSVSSFSMLAAFLSDRPYVWFEPNLYSIDGWRSIWGVEVDGVTTPTAEFANSATSSHGRGFALSGEEAELPPQLQAYLDTAARFYDRSNDLLHLGVIRYEPGQP